MVKDPIRRQEDAVADAVVLARTGRPRADWFAALDAAGADAWTHTQMARFLVEQGVDSWWSQSLTVAYEQARGRRAPGQRPDGTFETTVSKTVPAGVDRTAEWLTDEVLLRRWLDVVPTVRGVTPGHRVRWGWPDGSRVTVHLFSPAVDRTRVSVQHYGLTDGDVLAQVKDAWTARLALLHAAVVGDRADRA